MKYNSPLIPIALVFAACCIITSCSKSSSNSTKTLLIGTWVQTEVGSDANQNGKREASEVYPATADMSSIIIFKSNGTGMDLEPMWGGGKDTFQFTYKVIGNKELQVHVDNDSTVVLIDSISSTKLIFKDTSGAQLSWEIFTKQ